MGKNKPEPHVIDIVRRGTNQDLHDARELARRSKRFIFGPEESTFLGEFVRDFELTIVANREFAIPPYDFTYIEYDSNRFFEALGRPTTALEFGLDPDGRIGNMVMRYSGETLPMAFLDAEGKRHIKAIPPGWQIMGVCTTRDGNIPPSVMPLRTVWLDKGEPLKGREMRPAKFALGSTYDRITQGEREQVNNEIRIASMAERTLTENPDMLNELMRAGAGEMRTLWAALLLINRKGVTLEAAPHRVGLLRGKRHVFAAHNVVKLGLGNDVRKAYKAMGLSERGPCRRHDVRGHFMHFHVDRSCVAVQIDGDHEWFEIPAVAPMRRWKCTCCGTLRTWRASFARGDASIGYVTKDYGMGAVDG